MPKMGFVMLANVCMMPELLSSFEEGLLQLCRCLADSRGEEIALSDSTWFSQFAWLANLNEFSFGRALSAVILYPKGSISGLEFRLLAPDWFVFFTRNLCIGKRKLFGNGSAPRFWQKRIK